jgi:hypothetical protein
MGEEAMTLSDLLAGMPIPSFDPAAHAYALPGVGPVPSVTRIIRAAGLMDSRGWTPEARDRGTAVHDATHYADEGDLDPASVDPTIVGYMEAWESFKRESKWQSLGIEILLGNSRMRYAGKTDDLGILNNFPTVLDKKTGGKDHWHEIQTAGYALCLAIPVRRVTVHLKSNGKYYIETKEVFQNMEADGIFRAAVLLYHTRAEWGLLEDGK